ncbi:hypothetical protein WICPIJ_003898 [Wickerhamomyces pijperi]|uniref:RNase MRP protein 1 RNA binding domain-containing protein n=1 Tax=Wickerhamomyces pijperi TaxID=599730 RepID=A0A9P8TNT5_WICPI|nr:hypothetical protein WICPIJ_003898 [Wickerhamomyces pijperi]
MSTLLPTSSIRALIHECNLIRILYHRNKNQHHAAVWWKDLNALKRNLTKLITLLSQKPNSYKDKEILRLSKKLKFHIVKDCYRSFNGVIALGQFITLGMVLIGMLAKVHGEISKIQGVDDVSYSAQKQRQKSGGHEFHNMDIGEEIGEEINVEIQGSSAKEQIAQPPVTQEPLSMAVMSTISKDQQQQKKKKKTKPIVDGSSVNKVTKPNKEGKDKKKKKKKSAIDDIFG